MHTIKRTKALIITLFIIITALISGCSQGEKQSLIVYSGKGLKYAMDEIIQDFEKQEGIKVEVIYAGSETLLNTIQETRKGDIFIPGSKSYLKKAGEFATNHQYVAKHTPVFAVRKDQSEQLGTYSDLLKPGVKITVGNKNMAAIGKVAEAIMKNCDDTNNFRGNIVVTGTTVNELLQMLNTKEVDAALVWLDMLTWEQAKDLTMIAIPEEINEPKEIWISQLQFSKQQKTAKKFADFTASKGKEIFIRHGFK